MDVIQSFQSDRPRKRRRRTMACTQCRSRKLKCDREYPTCGRCQKSRTPNNCTYEDGFLWQQPATISAIAPGGGSTTQLAEPEQVPANTSTPESALREIRSEEPLSAASGSGPVPASATPAPRRRHTNRGFLETVLGAPKAVVNQEPYVNTDLLHRPKRLATEPERPSTVRSTHDDIDEIGSNSPLSPSDQLDLSPRIMMRGRETKTRFTGSGIIANVVTQVCLPALSCSS